MNSDMDDFRMPRRESESPFDESSDIPPGVLPRDVTDLGHSAFRTMWLHPRKTIRRIVEVDPAYRVNLLIALGGIAESLDNASQRNNSNDVPLGIVLASALVIGPGVALIGAWISAHLTRITGDWMGGRGEYREIKAAIGWSTLPTAVGLALWAALLALFGEQMFTKDGPALEGKAVEAIVYVALTMGLAVLNIWSLVLLCNSVAEVQRYRSAWAGLGNIILSGLIIIVPLLMLFLLVRILAGA